VTETVREPQVPALEELARDPASRRRFLSQLGGGTGAAAAFAVLLSACGDDGDGNGSQSQVGGGDVEVEISDGPTADPPSAPAPTPAPDVDIVNYALTLEYVEVAFYREVIQSGLFSGRDLDLLKTIEDHELQHTAALAGTVAQLGGTPVARPSTRFSLGGRAAVVELAATVENLGAAAYLGQAGRIKSKEVLAAALSIHTVEARHAAALNRLAGLPPTPDGAFARPATMAQVLRQVKPFIVT